MAAGGCAVILGTLPGVFFGAILRVRVLSDPDAFEVFVGLVVLLCASGSGAYTRWHVPGKAPYRGCSPHREEHGANLGRLLEPGREYGYGGKTYAFSTLAVFALSLGVGVVGGTYSTSGAARSSRRRSS